MQYSQIPTKVSVPWGASAGGGYITTIPIASQIGITPGRASFTDGFPPLNFLPVGAGGVPPFGQDMNGILNAITLWTQWQGAGGLTKYDAAYATAIGGYPFGALLASTTSGGAWLCTADNNLTNPDASGTNWVQIGSGIASQISVGTDSGSANVMTGTVSPVPTAYNDGALFLILKTNAANNGAMTGNIAGLGSHPIVMPDGSALPGGAWPASGMGLIEWNQARTSLILLNPAATAVSNGGLQQAEQAFALALSNLPTRSGAANAGDLYASKSVSDGHEVKLTLQQLGADLGLILGQNLAANGHQFFPGGFLINWAQSTTPITTETNQTFTFDFAFPTACVGVFGITRNNTSNVDHNSWWQLVSVSLSQAVLFNQGAPNSPSFQTDGYMFIAIGY